MPVRLHWSQRLSLTPRPVGVARSASPRSLAPSIEGSSSDFVGDRPAGGMACGDAVAALAPLCPIMISQNLFFASEIMAVGGESSSSSGGGGAGLVGARSLVASATPVHVRFKPYNQVGRQMTSLSPPFRWKYEGVRPSYCVYVRVVRL